MSERRNRKVWTKIDVKTKVNASRGGGVKVSYLLLYPKALRTLSLSLNMKVRIVMIVMLNVQKYLFDVLVTLLHLNLTEARQYRLMPKIDNT